MHLRIPPTNGYGDGVLYGFELNSANVKIATALAAANGKATAHTATLRGLAAAAEDAEAQLAALGLPLTRRRGARADYLSGGKVSKSYKFKRLVTHASLERGTGGQWFLVGCHTEAVWPTEAGSVTVSVPASEDDYLVAQLRARYSVIPATKTARIVKAATDAGFKVIHAPRPTILDDLIPIPVDVQLSVMRQFFTV